MSLEGLRRVLAAQARALRERSAAARASLSFAPGALADQQFIRFTYYQLLARRLPEFIARSSAGCRAIEFGGSNGVIAAYATEAGATYEVADFPAVDLHDLGDHPTEGYDLVITDQVLEHLERPETAVANMHRILRPGGLCVASTPFLVQVHGYPDDFRRFTRAGLRVLFSAFDEVEVTSWGNRYTLDVVQRYGWLSARNTRRLGHVALWNEEDWPITCLTLARKSPV